MQLEGIKLKIDYKIKNSQSKTINQVLKNDLHISNRLLSKLIANKKILLNGNTIDTREAVKINDEITILLDLEEENNNIVATKMQLNIVYEDDGILVINKPAGIAVHPSILHYSNTLSNGVKYYFNLINLKKKIRPVNRLDRNTSGLVIFAKNEYIQEELIRQMQNKTFKKEYIAICEGIFSSKEDTINLPIARKENSIIERCINKKGQESITHYKVIEETNNYSIVKCTLETGRTHQIRVHMQAIGHPLLGDTLYGNTSTLINRQALHCYKLAFTNPLTNSFQIITAPLPTDFNFIKNFAEAEFELM